jgi:hypothetical protein
MPQQGSIESALVRDGGGGGHGDGDDFDDDFLGGDEHGST